MPIHEVEAVVLRQYPLGEADRIVVLFSREQGLVRAVAKGTRRPKSRLGGCLEPLNLIHLHYYLKEGADLGKIRQCEIIHAFLGRAPSPEKLYLFTYFSEIIQETVQEYNPNANLYRLFVSCLRVGEAGTLNPALVRYFEIWSLRLAGILPSYDSCSSCGKYVKDFGLYALVETGQGLCPDCAGGKGIHLRPAAIAALALIAATPPGEFSSKPLAAGALGDLERLTQRHLEWHLEKRLKSYPALRQLFRGE